MPNAVRRIQATRSKPRPGTANAPPLERHVVQFKIGCLELDRMRRLKEKSAALERIQRIDARIAEIDAEIRRHQLCLGYSRAPQAEPTPGGSETCAEEAGQMPRRRIRYGG